MTIFARAVGRVVSRMVVRSTTSRMTSRGYSRGTSNRSTVRQQARSALRFATAGRLGEIGELAEEIGELYEEANELIEGAYYEAMDTMYGMCANPGQETVFFNYIIDAFAAEMENTELGEQWNDVDIGEYMAFMGEIVETGNQIMSAAYDEAAGLASEAEDVEADLEALEEEGLDPDEFF